MANNENCYVIIGASAAGMAAAEAIRQSDSTGVITVLSEEPVQPYFRPMIPFLISGKKSAADMTLIGQGCLAREPRFRDKGLTQLTEHVLLLERKP